MCQRTSTFVEIPQRTTGKCGPLPRQTRFNSDNTLAAEVAYREWLGLPYVPQVRVRLERARGRITSLGSHLIFTETGLC
jgi:hypothetical protein